MVGNSPFVAASIDGHPVAMLLDTGAARSLIWRSAAKDLNLNIEPANATFYGAGGGDNAGVVWTRDFAFAGATFHRIPFYTAGRGTLAGQSAGTIGEDFLSRWDIELDLSAGKVRLFTPKHCDGDQVVYWAPQYSMVKLIRAPENSNWLEANVRLNDHEAVAMFDSGAYASTVTSQALQQAHILPESPVVDQAPGLGLAAKAIATTAAVFPTLTIGQETVRNVRLRIADLFGNDLEMQTGSHIRQKVFDVPDLVIGADFFLAHRIYVANSQGKIYFTYKSGPVFQPIKPAPDAPAAADQHTDSSKIGPHSN